MVHHHQPGLVEIKHFAEFLGDSDFIRAVLRRKLLFAAQRQKFLRIGFDAAGLADRQAERRRAEDVGNKFEPLAVPGIKIRARPAGQGQFVEYQLIRRDRHVHQRAGKVEPARSERVEFVVLADADSQSVA